MTFRSTGIRREHGGFVLDGDLTIRGVTHPVSLAFEVNGFGPDPQPVMAAGPGRSICLDCGLEGLVVSRRRRG
jgi:YceI-like domain